MNKIPTIDNDSTEKFRIDALNTYILYIHQLFSKLGFVPTRSGVDEAGHVYHEGTRHDNATIRIEFTEGNKNK